MSHLGDRLAALNATLNGASAILILVGWYQIRFRREREAHRKIMLSALSKSGPDAKKLRDAIENVDGFKGVTSAPAKPFGPDRHHSLEAKDMFAAVWKNGELVKAP